jgi:hypothetical protein
VLGCGPAGYLGANEWGIRSVLGDASGTNAERTQGIVKLHVYYRLEAEECTAREVMVLRAAFFGSGVTEAGGARSSESDSVADST